jgi:hypothetical protein
MVLWMQNYAYFAHRRYYNEEPPKIKGAGRTELIYEKHRHLATLTNPAQEKKNGNESQVRQTQKQN